MGIITDMYQVIDFHCLPRCNYRDVIMDTISWVLKTMRNTANAYQLINVSGGYNVYYFGDLGERIRGHRY